MRCLSLLVSFTILTALGCSGGDSPSSASRSNGDNAATSESSVANHPAAVSSSRFLNAIAAGDQTTAMDRLTPMAAEQLNKNGKGFAFSAVEQAEFVVTRVEQPDPTMAAVEYHMKASAEGQTVEFDVCCFMQEIDGDWRLGGIAYDLGNGEEPVVVNYEAAPQPPASAVQTANSGSSTANPAGTSGSPPMSAQNERTTDLR